MTCAGASGKKRPVRGIVYLLWGIMILFLYFLSLVSTGKLAENNTQTVFLEAPGLDWKQVGRILESEKKLQEAEMICFYSDLGRVSIIQKEYNRRTTVSAGMLMGDASVYDRRISGFSEEDKEGCVIDSQSALELWGSTEPEGSVWFQNQEYKVRMVLPCKNRIFFIRSGNSHVKLFDRVFVNRHADEFLLRNGLSGMVIDYKNINIVIFMIVSVLPLELFFEFMIHAYREGKQQKGVEKAIWLLLVSGALALGLWKAGSCMVIPENWIPGRWSDFAFWQKRIGEAMESLKLFVILPKTAREGEWIFLAGNAVVTSVLSYVFYLKSPYFSEKR